MTTDPFPFDGDTCFACRQTGLTSGPDSRMFYVRELSRAGYEVPLCERCGYIFGRVGALLTNLVAAVHAFVTERPELAVICHDGPDGPGIRKALGITEPIP